MESLSQKKAEKKITVIGAAILDILAGPVDESVFQIGSQAMKSIQMTFGGDALNETLALSSLGKKSELISLLGKDETGKKILDHCHSLSLSTEAITLADDIQTGMNIVLVGKDGERRFLTNPDSTLRKLSEDHILPHLANMGEIVSFASLFVSHALDLCAMESICRRIKEKPGRTLVMDMTKPKNGESLDDLRPALPYVDYMLPNQEEIAMLTGESDPVINARLLVEAGVKHAVIKVGKHGCILGMKQADVPADSSMAMFASSDVFDLSPRSAQEGSRTDSCLFYHVPSYKVENVVDTTGAGDCFAAGFLWALSEGWNPVECCQFACAAASCTVESFGATTGLYSFEQVMKRYQQMSQLK